MDVSVIVPVYNVEKYLATCLDSLVNQSLARIEIICVDDGSTDESLTILRDYEKRYDQVIVITKENGGLSDARNVGLIYALGEYVGFVDSDDWVDLNFFEMLYRQAKVANADICMCDMMEVYPDERKPLCDFNLYYPNLSHPMVCNKLFKRTLIHAGGIQFPKGLWYEDNVFTYQCFLNQPTLSHVSDVYYYYRRKREGSIMSSQLHQKIDDIYEVATILYHYQKTKTLTAFEQQQFELYFIRGVFFRHIPKFLRLYAKQPLTLIKKLKSHYQFLITYYPDWLQNPLLLEDKDDYFKQKLGPHYLTKIKGLSRVLSWL
ncbi:MAG TPA: hypothetical protein DCY20_06690 [Firmicutes bacterium]|nr:hypothetical protein [Bacillota bacterium]